MNGKPKIISPWEAERARLAMGAQAGSLDDMLAGLLSWGREFWIAGMHFVDGRLVK